MGEKGYYHVLHFKIRTLSEIHPVYLFFVLYFKVLFSFELVENLKL